MALYIVSIHIIQSNSRTSNHHWKLDTDEGKVIAMPNMVRDDNEKIEFGFVNDDPLLSILTNKITTNGEWRLEGGEPSCSDDCSKRKYDRYVYKQKHKYSIFTILKISQITAKMHANVFSSSLHIPVKTIEPLMYYGTSEATVYYP